MRQPHQATSACTEYAQHIINGDAYHSKGINPDSADYTKLEKLAAK
jgi:hypothetical protein